MKRSLSLLTAILALYVFSGGAIMAEPNDRGRAEWGRAEHSSTEQGSADRDRNERGRDERDERRDHDFNNNQRAEGRDRDFNRHQSADRRHRHFNENQTAAINDYYQKEYRRGRCPPGLAKKHNGCVPPGHARRWAFGRPLPRDVIFYDLPSRVLWQLGPPPPRHRYVRVAQDILLIAVGTGLVVDAIDNLNWEYRR